MNQTYWAEKQKNQTQMLRVIHDQMYEFEEDMRKEWGEVNKAMGCISGYVKESTTNYVAHRDSIEILAKRIDILVKRIDMMSDAILTGLKPQKRVKKKAK
tara:strand:+ start:50 stop:349 length:300 start_codon:yes stop_codon:yes gene_type:complete